MDTNAFKSRVIDLVQSLDAMAAEQRLKDSQAAVNCAQASAALRSWLEEMGLGPTIELLEQ